MPGLPQIISGRSKYLTFGVTAGHTDTFDFFEERIRDDTHYFYDGEWQPLRSKVEKFFVKGEPEPRLHTLYSTHRGPLLKDSIFKHTFNEINKDSVSHIST